VGGGPRIDALVLVLSITPLGHPAPLCRQLSIPCASRSEYLTAFFGKTPAVRDVSLTFPANTVTAIIGPSGCGKSTFLRCLNRMHELSDNAGVRGRVLLDGRDIYDTGDPIAVRRRVGMVFQRPTPFPMMSIYDNVAAGLRVNGRR